MEGKSPRQILEDYKQIILDTFRKSLKDNDIYVSGGLAKSFKVNVRSFATEMVLEVTADDYWKFVDKGVDGWEKKVGSPYKFKKAGKQIPHKQVLSFIANRGITPRNLGALKGKRKLNIKQKNKKKSAFDSMAWAMGYNIKRKGIKPTHFVQDALDTGFVPKLQKDISIALKRDILLEFKIQ